MLRSALRSFHAVATHGGFSAASKAVNISQPTLSTQVKALEERYQVELFMRAGRGVRLTLAGAELLQQTARLAQIEEETEDLLDAFRGLHAGSLRIAAVGPFHATEMIVAYKAKYPGVEVDVRFANSQRSFESLLRYDADVGVIAEVPEDPKVSTIHYSVHRVVVFVNGHHRFFDRDAVSIRDLQGERVVRRERGSTTRTAIEAALAESGVSILPVLDLGSREGVWKAVERGLGIGFVADFEFVAHPNLRAVPIMDAAVETNYFLAFLKEREHSRLVRSFCEVAMTVPMREETNHPALRKKY